MKLISTTSFLALISLAGPSLALDLGGGFSLTGNLEYERLNTSTSDHSIARIDSDLTYEHSSGFGGFVGIYAFSAGSSDAEAFYGALTYSGNFGKLQLGAPRNALDDYVDAPAIGGVDYLDVMLGSLSGSVLPTVLLSGGDSATGLRYDGSFGAVDVGASYHWVDGGKVLDAAMNYRLGEATILKAGYEHLSISGDSRRAYFLGAEHDFGQVTAGVIASDSNLVGGSIRGIQANAVYSPTDRLDVTASALNITSSGPDGTLYGLSVNYDLSDNVYFEAGFMDSNSGMIGIGDIAAVSIGVNF